MSDIRGGQEFEISRAATVIGAAMGGGGFPAIAYGIFAYIGWRPFIFLELVGSFALGAFIFGIIAWGDLYPEQNAYLTGVQNSVVARLQAFIKRASDRGRAIYQFCTGSFLGAAIAGIPLGIAFMAFIYHLGSGIPSDIREWPFLAIAGSISGVCSTTILHGITRIRWRFLVVPAATAGAFFIGALFTDFAIRAGCYAWAAAVYGNPAAHWSDVLIGIDCWGVWARRAGGAIAAVATFLDEIKKGSGARGQFAWSLKTARNGLLTIGMVGGEGWRTVKELLLAALAGGAWWLAWHFGLASYQLDTAPWHIAVTAAITLAAIPFISYRTGLAIEHVMRAGAAISPPADDRPPTAPRVNSTGTVDDAIPAGQGGKTTLSPDDLVY